MGCGSAAGLLLGAEGMGERVAGGVEEGRAVEHVGVMVEVAGFLGIIV